MGHFTAPGGILTSPSYPNNYPDDADCVYTISLAPGTQIQLIVQSMDIEYHSVHNDDYGFYHQNNGGVTCMFDYLEIYDGPSEQSPLIDEYCGDARVIYVPLNIRTTQNNVWMR